MRRPVRPFVTEYRGGSRRPSSQGHGLDVDPFKTAEPSPSVSGAWPPMAPSPHPEAQEDGYDAALRAADALFAGRRPVPDTQPETDESSKLVSPTGGRVLRVLDEAPSPEMLEMERLEAEHAPKKRGRKPGSKNKPKVAALEVVPPPTVPAAAPIEAPAIPAAIVTAALAARAIATAPRRTEPAAPGERYAWVRTRLKPGQQWKRRLPKVAW